MIEIPVGVECYLVVETENVYVDTGYDERTLRRYPKIKVFTNKKEWEAAITQLVVAGKTDFIPLVVKRPEIQTTVAVKFG